MATAICIVSGKLPPEIVDISLSLPARVKLPLAPPLTLVLQDCTFQPFPVSNLQGQHPVAAVSGDSLQLRSEGQVQRHFFSKQVSDYGQARCPRCVHKQDIEMYELAQPVEI